MKRLCVAVGQILGTLIGLVGSALALIALLVIGLVLVVGTLLGHVFLTVLDLKDRWRDA